MELIITNLTKNIEGRSILNHIDLSLKKGEALGLRGKNGSGKTTLLRILSGYDKDFSGEVSVTDSPTSKIGYVPQEVVLFEEMSVRDNFRIFAGAEKSGKEIKNEITLLSKEFEIEDLLSKRVHKLSGGQKRLIHLLISFLSHSDILFLDEVIVGIDEEKVEKIEEVLLRLRKDKIMIITSHQDDFLRRTCNRFATLSGGRVDPEEKDEKTF